MRLKSGILILVFLVSFTAVFAQESDQKPIPLTSYTFSGGVSSVFLTDQYLSELPYAGLGIHGEYTFRRPLRLFDGRFSQRLDFQGFMAGCVNEPASASMMYLGEQLGYGIQRHYRCGANLEILAGPEIGTQFGIKSYGREVNNPLNLDLAANLELALTLRYTCTRNSRVVVDIRSPLAGVMFVPERGESYYEILDLLQTDHTMHFTSLHNKTGMDLNAVYQYKLAYTVFEVGIKSSRLHYKANEMFFKTDYLQLKAGVTLEMAFFGGRHNPVTQPYVSAQ